MIDDLDEKKKEALRLTWERVRCRVFEGSGQGLSFVQYSFAGYRGCLTSLTLASLPGVGGLGLAFCQHQVQSLVQGVLQGLRGLLVAGQHGLRLHILDAAAGHHRPAATARGHLLPAGWVLHPAGSAVWWRAV